MCIIALHVLLTAMYVYSMCVFVYIHIQCVYVCIYVYMCFQKGNGGRLLLRERKRNKRIDEAMRKPALAALVREEDFLFCN